MTGSFVALNIDGGARFYGLGARGVGHVVLIPSGMHSDPLACDTLEKACDGKALESGRLAEKFDGDRKCARCVKWLESDGGKNDLEAARQDKWDDENGPGLAAIMGEFTLITLDDVQTVTVDGTDTREDSAPESVPAAEIAKDAAAAGVKAPARKRGKRKAPAAPAAPESDAVGITGLTHAEMRAAVERYYANGGAVPAEIAALPAPGTVNLASGTVSGSAAEILVCGFKGEVSTVNPERTHGKCPECTTYIPLLPGGAGGKETGPKVSKIKCEGTGKAPAPGTRVMRDDHTVSVADDYDGKHSGKCPECARVIAVSREGGMRKHNGLEVREATGADVDKIGKHNVGGVATPAGKGLSSKSIDTVEHGSVPGDPASADKRRAAEIEERGADAREFKGGADTGATVRKGARLALSRGHGSVDGSATTGSQNMAPVQPKGWVGVAGTGSLPAMVRPGIDPEVTGRECVLCGELPEIAHKGKSRGWRRRHSSMVGAVLRERKAKRDAERAAKIERGEIASTAERKAGRKAASTGSFAEGTCAGVVSHEPRPEFAPKGERRPAGWKAGKVTRDAARKALDSVGK
jgi:hypothetical protein